MFPKAKTKREKNRKVKLNLVFNEDNRKDFLTGFHKRKLQRKKIAKEKLAQELKEEKKRLKAEAKESYKKLVKSHMPIPEVEDLIKEEYDDEDVNVKVEELSTNEIAKRNHWIGANQPVYEDERSDSNPSDDNDEDVADSKDEIPGMELTSKPVDATNDNGDVEKSKSKLKSKVEIKKILKKQATKNVQKSKAFQLKNKLEKRKQQKKASQKKKLQMKMQNKFSKTKNKKGKSLR